MLPVSINFQWPSRGWIFKIKLCRTDKPRIYLFYSLILFFSCSQNLCVPMTYLPMLHSDFAADLKYFRTKSKSWGGEKIGRHRPRRTLTDVDERGISSWLL